VSSQRSKDLTNDLLQDIAAGDAPSGEPVPRTAAEPVPSATFETALFLNPRRWSRPRAVHIGSSFTLSAGPVRMRLRRH
jgi:hypothetical protein